MAEKCFEATVKRLEKAKKNGQNGKSLFFSQSLAQIFLMISVCYLFEPIFLELKKMLECHVVVDPKDLFQGVNQIFNIVFFIFVKFVGSCLMFAAVLATFCEALQVGFRVESKLLAPSISRISPISYVKNLPRNFKKLLINILPVISILILIVSQLNKNIIVFESTLVSSSFEKFNFIKSNLLILLWSSVIIFLIVSLIDIVISRKKFRKDTMMTLEELKEELKESEGNPEMRTARLQAHQALLYEEIVRRVRRSKFIVVAKERGGFL